MLQLVLLQGFHRRLTLSHRLEIELSISVALPCRLEIVLLAEGLPVKIAPQRGTLQTLRLQLIRFHRMINTGALSFQFLYLLFGGQACNGIKSRVGHRCQIQLGAGGL